MLHILASPTPPQKKKRTKQRPGTLEFLSESMWEVARHIAATGMFLTVYDNINMVWKVAEQIVGRTGELIVILVRSREPFAVK